MFYFSPPLNPLHPHKEWRIIPHRKKKTRRVEDVLVESQAGRRNWSVTWRGSSGGGQQELFPPEFPPLVLSTLLLSFHLFNPFPRTSPGCLAAFPLASPSLFTETFLLLPPLLLLLTSLSSPLNLFPPIPPRPFWSFLQFLFFPPHHSVRCLLLFTFSTTLPRLGGHFFLFSFFSLSPPFPLSSLRLPPGSTASLGRSHSNAGSFQPAASPCSTATMLSVI